MARLSKSRFTTGLQCHRLLWWKAHNRDAPELETGPGLQTVFDAGHRVGDLARQHVPGGVLVDLDPRAPQAAINQTAQLLAGADTPPIYEASFREDGVFVAVDILKHDNHGASPGFVLIEVKSTLSAKPEHIPDIAVQVHVLRAAGLPVVRAELMHLNRDHRHPDREPLFVREDVTERVEAYLPEVPGQLAAMAKMLEGTLPNVTPGAQCDRPRACPFQARCYPRPHKHDLSELHTIGAPALVRLRATGARRIHDLPDDLPADVTATGPRARQVQAVKTGRVVVDPGLSAALSVIKGPVTYLDFETINPALPVWPGTGPYPTVPVQFSVHCEHPDGTLSAHPWLAIAGHDPRPALAAALVEALPRTGSILAWQAGFEKGCMEQLAAAVPEHAEALLEAAGRLVDLLPITRKHVYHPDFRGSFSLKKVMPALVPGWGYDGLQVADGDTASRLLQKMLLYPEALGGELGELDGGLEGLRQALLAYCERDTLGLVQVHRALVGLGALGPPPSPATRPQ